MEAVAQRVGGQAQTKKYRCTENNCRSIVIRMDKHITKVHDMVRGTVLYNAAMDRSKLPENIIVAPIVIFNDGDDSEEDMNNAAAPNVANVDEAERMVSDSDSDAPLIRYVNRRV